MTQQDLISFTNKILTVFERGDIRAPVHFSGGNEGQLLEIFKEIAPTDYVFSTWRSHYHALLHGVPEDLVYNEILAGHSITLQFPEYRFYTSAIVGSTTPMATGAALAIKQQALNDHVWCFIGDMVGQCGIFYESLKYSEVHDLPITFVIEDNDLSVDTPTAAVWKKSNLQLAVEQSPKVIYYKYVRKYAHMGSGKWIAF